RVCAVGALAGLVARQAGGTGIHVEVAQVETVLGMMSNFFLKEALEPGSVQPEGNRRERGAPWGVYQCSGEERWIVIACRDDTDWAGLRRAMGDPEWAADPDLATAAGRHRRHDEVDSHIGAW